MSLRTFIGYTGLVAFLVCSVPICWSIGSPVVDISVQMESGSAKFVLSWSDIEASDYYSVYHGSTPYSINEFLLSTVLNEVALSIPQLEDSNTHVGFFSVVARKSHRENYTIVPSGTFTMGSIEVGGLAAPEHSVTITRSYVLGTYEVTNAEFMIAVQWAFDQGLVDVTSECVCASGLPLLYLNSDVSEIKFEDEVFYIKPSSTSYGFYGPGSAYPSGYDPSNHPVKFVSWYGAAKYCDWLNEIDGRELFYWESWDQTSSHNPYRSGSYRLPTEAEWEHAARYPDGREYPWGNSSASCDLVNFSPGWPSFCVGWTSPVGSYPNGVSQLGLYDMSGNVWEWLGDWRSEYSDVSLVDPFGGVTGGSRSSRGGDWEWDEPAMKCAFRNLGNANPDVASAITGFRICRTEEANNPPSTPFNPSPNNGEVEVDPGSLVHWNCSDTDNDEITYDLYFGTDQVPQNSEIYVTSQQYFRPLRLAESTQYYWQIVAHDSYGGTSISPIWHFTTNSGNLVVVPAGSFSMGGIPQLFESDTNYVDPAFPEHTVTLTNNFLIGRTETTNQEYLSTAQWALDNSLASIEPIGSLHFLVSSDGYRLLKLDDGSEIAFVGDSLYLQEVNGGIDAYPLGYDPASFPVKYLSWYGAVYYCDWLSMMSGLPAFYAGNFDQNEEHDPYTAIGYRLPTEAEWEYAASYGGDRSYPWGDTRPNCSKANIIFQDELDNFNCNYCVGWSSPVGSYASGVSALGIFDLCGNVNEFVGDAFRLYTGESSVNPYMGSGASWGPGITVKGKSYLGAVWAMDYCYSTGQFMHDNWAIALMNHGRRHSFQNSCQPLVGMRLCKRMYN